MTFAFTRSSPVFVVKLAVNGVTLFPARSWALETAILITALSGSTLMGVKSTSVVAVLPVESVTKLMLMGAMGVATLLTRVVICTVLVEIVVVFISLLNRTSIGALVPTLVEPFGGVTWVTSGATLSGEAPAWK